MYVSYIVFNISPTLFIFFLWQEFGIVDNEEYIEDKNTLHLTFRTRKEAEIVRINISFLMKLS